MRLLTHNSLTCTVAACVSTATVDADEGARNFPLVVRPAQVERREAEFQPELLQRLAPRLHWPALSAAAAQLGLPGVPEACAPEQLQDEAFLRNLHEVLLEAHVVSGALECPHCGRAYPIEGGTANMQLEEEEL